MLPASVAGSSASLRVHPPLRRADEFFEYWPSLALACIALSLYTVIAVIVGWLTERRKAYRFVHLIT